MPHYDFGYTWPWNYGHLVLASITCLAAIVARRRRWPAWIFYALAGVTTWGVIGFLTVQFAFRMNQPLELPTSAFLTSGKGKVLDMGCGSGRSSLMVLLARPGTTVVALDNFSADYIRDNGPDLLRANMRAGGVESRVQVQPGDMRAMPLGSGTFDAVVSTYAIDHLGASGEVKALAEAERVLRPGGEFLLMVMKRDVWMNVAYPPLLAMHGHLSSGPSWRRKIEAAGLIVVEEGTLPATSYYLCGKPPKGSVPR